MNFLPIFLIPNNNMIDYIKGTIAQVTPTFVTIETGGIGYFINISLTTFSKLEKQK